MTEYLERQGWAIAYEDTAGPAPVLILCHALGADRAMWDRQVEMLGSRRRLVRYDHRGHGGSGAPPPPYTMADLGDDVLALADHLGVERFDFCGISMGGQVGLWLDAIPDAELAILDAAHLSNVERPDEFGSALSGLLAG